MKKMLSILIAAVFAGSLLCTPMVVSAVEKAVDSVTGKTVRLEKTEGTVTLKTAGGNTLPTRSNMKLLNGYSVSTGLASYAYVNLDDTKAVKLDEASSATINKSGKKLELLVSSGKIFVDVTKHLDADESLNIRTPNMVTGIRGTALEVNCVSPNTTEIKLLEGSTVATVTDPVTGKTQEVEIRAGEKVTISAPIDGGAAPAVNKNALTNADISGFAGEAIAASQALKDRINSAGTNLNADKIAESAPEKKQQEQSAKREEKKKSDDQVKAKNEATTPPVTTPPVTTPPTTTDKPSGGGDPGVTEPAPQPPQTHTTLSGDDITLNKVTKALRDYTDVTLDIGEGNTATLPLTPSNGVIIPWGRRLTIDSGTLALGTSTSGKVEIYGTLIINDNSNLLNVATFNNKGSIQVAGSRTSEDAIITNTGAFTMSWGSVLNAGASSAIKNDGTFDMSGGIVSSSVANNANKVVPVIHNTETFRMSGGSVVATALEFATAIYSTNGTVAISGGELKSNYGEAINCAKTDTSDASLDITGNAKISGLGAINTQVKTTIEGDADNPLLRPEITANRNGISMSHELTIKNAAVLCNNIGISLEPATPPPSLTIESGSIITSNGIGGTNGTAIDVKSGSLEIKDGTITANGIGGKGISAASTDATSKITISGGKVSGRAYGIHSSIQTEISDGSVTSEGTGIRIDGTTTLTVKGTANVVGKEKGIELSDSATGIVSDTATVSGEEIGIDLLDSATGTVTTSATVSSEGTAIKVATNAKLEVFGGTVKKTASEPSAGYAIDGVFTCTNPAVIKSLTKESIARQLPSNCTLPATATTGWWALIIAP